MKIEYGYCQCGCGGRTSLATKTRTKYGIKKGEPVKFIPSHTTKKYASDSDRFWAKVGISDKDDCWNWLPPISHKFGYGHFTAKGKQYGSHRFAWVAAHGDIPEGLCVLHKCDNPSCCNPHHLFLGTTLDNINDKIQKGRAKGRYIPERHAHRLKLNPDKVIAIRNLFDNGVHNRTELSKMFGVSVVLIGLVVAKKSWKHV